MSQQENPKDQRLEAEQEQELVPPGRSFLVGCFLGIGLLIVATPLILFLGFRRSATKLNITEQRLDHISSLVNRIPKTKSQFPIALGLGADFSGQESLFKAGIKVPDSYLESGLMVDGWGGPILYKCEAGNEYRLISCGPNGKNDNGQFDDLVKTGQLSGSK